MRPLDIAIAVLLALALLKAYPARADELCDLHGEVTERIARLRDAGRPLSSIMPILETFASKQIAEWIYEPESARMSPTMARQIIEGLCQSAPGAFRRDVAPQPALRWKRTREWQS